MARVQFTSDSLSPTLAKWTPTLRRNVFQVLNYHQPGIVAMAKTNAKWTDRTGNARNGLDAKVSVIGPGVYCLTLFGRVPYQIWLEVAHQGRFAIIMPTVLGYFPIVIGTLEKLLERMGPGS